MSIKSPETIISKTGLKKSINTSGFFVLPYVIFFFTFVILLILISVMLSFTYYDTINFPHFIGLRNYINLLTQDTDFMQFALPTTIKYALIVGPGGYLLSFILAWILAQIPHRSRTVAAIIIYSPALTSGVLMTVVWRVVFAGDNRGYLNNLLLNMGVINAPVQWLQDPKTITLIMLFVGLWSSMGIGFLAMLSGILNINKEIYEAAYIDGLKNRWQEIFYITIPSMKPQMLFGMVMAIVSTFNASGIAAALTLSTPPPQLAGWLIVDHMNDFGFGRYEMGYASALSVVLVLMVLLFSRIAKRLFGGDNE
ncbi:MAG: sugar ABC transporter permease [Acholeplasmatales bacterium]|nr:sugar ABC transporter permease [Acholeplasmataceae bacterium]MCK9289073.1 sugar ABC transporter permease [Acholeplasmataceae bacterium]MCK9427374.1 sugar ABC transporter permease [Acholeplasmataceae bacterium]MDY0115755.1 sugar ABC transporter permease [Acholeplasmatales bacterium]